MNSNHWSLRWLSASIGTTVVLLLIGCGSSEELPTRCKAEGEVRLNGELLAYGVIRFIPQEAGDNRPAAATNVVDGKFAFTGEYGPVPGVQRVEIEATDHQSFAIDDEAAFAQKATATRKNPIEANPVPPRYNTQSELKETIQEDSSNQFSFALESTPRPSPTR